MASPQDSRRIKILRESVVRRIAAGEVIERPASVARELLDNSIDAGAGEINVQLEEGGIRSIRVVDNGSGMSKADLELCVLPHATSKIESAEDLYRIGSLGFRGEALSSIAAVSKLEITSRISGDDNGSKIVVQSGSVVALDSVAAPPGTSVHVGDLFYNLPGRRKFVKSAATEMSQCRSVFSEKVLAHPGIRFRLFVDGTLRQFFDTADHDRRIVESYPDLGKRALIGQKSEESAPGLEIAAYLTDPGFSRRDRRLIQIFVNRRRIQDFGLVQSVMYGYAEHLPGGRYPAVFVFMEIDPALVDFNIHPAKREVRFRNYQDVHAALTRCIKSALAPYVLRGPLRVKSDDLLAFDKPSTAYGPQRANTFSGGAPTPQLDVDRLKAMVNRGRTSSAPVDEKAATKSTPTYPPESREVPPHDDRQGAAVSPEAAGNAEIRYLGQIFGVFLLAELGGRLYIVDQHAAHERLLYDRLRAESKQSQSLLVPYEFSLVDRNEGSVKGVARRLHELGIEMDPVRPGAWAIRAMPAVCTDMEAVVAEFVQEAKGEPTNLEQELFAMLACRAAIKDGDTVDSTTARELILAALELDNARCPHGRPIWFELSREELYQLVGRT